MRDILRALLESEASLVVVDAEPVDQTAARVVARLLVAARDEAARVAASMRSDVPVVVVTPDGRWAGRFVGGRLEDAASDASARDLVRLVAAGERAEG